MAYSLQLSSGTTEVSARAVVSAMTADTEAQAVSHLSGWQKFTDFIGATKHEEAIRTLFKLVHADDSISYQKKIRKLAALVVPEQQKAFVDAFRIEVRQENGNSIARILLSDHYVAEVEFEGTLHLEKLWFQQVFNKTNAIPGRSYFQLKPESLQLINIESDPNKFWKEHLAHLTAISKSDTVAVGDITQIKKDSDRLAGALPEKGSNGALTKEGYRTLVKTTLTPFFAKEKLTAKTKQVYSAYEKLSIKEKEEFKSMSDLSSDGISENVKAVYEEYKQLSQAEKKEFSDFLEDPTALRLTANGLKFDEMRKKLSPPLQDEIRNNPEALKERCEFSQKYNSAGKAAQGELKGVLPLIANLTSRFGFKGTSAYGEYLELLKLNPEQRKCDVAQMDPNSDFRQEFDNLDKEDQETIRSIHKLVTDLTENAQQIYGDYLQLEIPVQQIVASDPDEFENTDVTEILAVLSALDALEATDIQQLKWFDDFQSFQKTQAFPGLDQDWLDIFDQLPVDTQVSLTVYVSQGLKGVFGYLERAVKTSQDGEGIFDVVKNNEALMNGAGAQYTYECISKTDSPSCVEYRYRVNVDTKYKLPDEKKNDDSVVQARSVADTVIVMSVPKTAPDSKPQVIGAKLRLETFDCQLNLLADKATACKNLKRESRLEEENARLEAQFLQNLGSTLRGSALAGSALTAFPAA